MAVDPSYPTGNYHSSGNLVWTVGATGQLDIQTGGKITNAGTQASAITALTDSTTGAGAAGGTLAAFSVAAAGTVTAAQVAVVNTNISTLAAQIQAINAAVKGVGITA